MNLMLSEDEVMVRDSARDFLAAECKPALVRRVEKDPLGYAPQLWDKAVELGWPGMILPEAFGGMGMPPLTLGLVVEEVGRAIAPLPLASTAVAAATILAHGSEPLKAEALPAVARDGSILCWAVTEQDPRNLPASITMQALADGDGFILNGTKRFVDYFSAASDCIVACRTSAACAQNEGISLFLVDTHSAGITSTLLVTLAKDGQRAVMFDKVRVPAGRLIGRLGEGARPLAQMLDFATALLCAQMVGAARKDAEMAFDYAKYRVAFNQPIGAFQSIQHMCADMLIWLDGGAMLTYEALWKLGQGLPASVEISQAKAFCNEKCEAVVRNSQIIHGGIGFTMELDLHLWYRRVAAWTMRLGTTHEHRARVAAALLDPPGRVVLGDPLPV